MEYISFRETMQSFTGLGKDRCMHEKQGEEKGLTVLVSRKLNPWTIATLLCMYIYMHEIKG